MAHSTWWKPWSWGGHDEPEGYRPQPNTMPPPGGGGGGGYDPYAPEGAPIAGGLAGAYKSWMSPGRPRMPGGRDVGGPWGDDIRGLGDAGQARPRGQEGGGFWGDMTGLEKAFLVSQGAGAVGSIYANIKEGQRKAEEEDVGAFGAD